MAKVASDILAEAGRGDFSRAALVLAGHGSSVHPDSSTPVRNHAEALRARGIFSEVVCCFWKEEPAFRDWKLLVQSPVVFVVPVFISEGYYTRTVIPREMGLTGPLTNLENHIVAYCPPVGNHPRMTDVLLRRASEVAPGIPPAETCLMIAGHGTELDKNSATAAREQSAIIQAHGLYAEVMPVYMEEPPRIGEWDQHTSQPHVVMVPFFISDGLHTHQDIPLLLGIRPKGGPEVTQRELLKRNPHHLRGKTLCYAGAIGTEPLLQDVILDQVTTFLTSGVLDSVQGS